MSKSKEMGYTSIIKNNILKIGDIVVPLIYVKIENKNLLITRNDLVASSDILILRSQYQLDILASIFYNYKHLSTFQTGSVIKRIKKNLILKLPVYLLENQDNSIISKSYLKINQIRVILEKIKSRLIDLLIKQ